MVWRPSRLISTNHGCFKSFGDDVIRAKNHKKEIAEKITHIRDTTYKVSLVTSTTSELHPKPLPPPQGKPNPPGISKSVNKKKPPPQKKNKQKKKKNGTTI